MKDEDPDALLIERLTPQEYRLAIQRLRLALRSMDVIKERAPELFEDRATGDAYTALQAFVRAFHRAPAPPAPTARPRPHLRVVKRKR